MLYEDDVVGAVCDFLERKGFRIVQRLTSKEHGVDIIARTPAPALCEIRIEAKGQTSAKEGSKGYGQEFTRAQKRVHVAEAVYAALRVLSGSGIDGRVCAGIALPNTPVHHEFVDTVHTVLEGLQVAVFWVSGNREVQVAWPKCCLSVRERCKYGGLLAGMPRGIAGGAEQNVCR